MAPNKPDQISCQRLEAMWISDPYSELFGSVSNGTATGRRSHFVDTNGTLALIDIIPNKTRQSVSYDCMKSLYLMIGILVLSIQCTPCSAMISIRELSKEDTKGLGITMKHRMNGDAGVKVWLEFKKEGFLEKVTYCSLRMTKSNGEHLLSAMLRPNPVNHRQSKDIVSVAFSAAPEKLKNCSFMIVAYGSSRGDVGYSLHLKDFIDTKQILFGSQSKLGD